MAVFIPEWQRASGCELQIKRVLAALDDSHVVRRPLRQRDCPVDLFVQHATKGWIALAVSPVPFAELDPESLFDSPARVELEQRLVALAQLGGERRRSGHGMAVLVVMWGCAADEVRALGRAVLLRHGVRLVSREQFVQLGAKLVGGLLEAVHDDTSLQLLGEYFPENEIAAECTTRRHDARDNRARLQRFFLDREQEWAAKLDLELSHEAREATSDSSVRLVNGVAGSGKTLIAMHRAQLLAESYPRRRILLLIHNTPVVADLQNRWRQARGELLANIDVLTFFAWAHRQWRSVFGAAPRMPGDPRAVLELVRHHRRRWPDLRASDAQLVGELDFLNETLIGDESAYLDANRAGRGFALRGVERSQVWALYVTVTEALRARGQQMWSALPRAICMARAQHPALQRYEHILIDEAQFFAPSWFELIKLSLAAQGRLFLCADPKQGFMRHRLSWKSAGLDVAGRTKKLRRSYRTTRAVLNTATAMLDLSAPIDPDNDLAPDFTEMDAGTRPMLLYADSPQDAIDRLVNELVALTEEQLPLGAFLVIYGDNTNRQALHSQLVKRFGARKVWWFNERDQKKEPPGGRGVDHLRMAFLDTATGLEASVVFLIGVESLFVSADADDEGTSTRREENMRKLYMAMTRAGQKLVLLSSRCLSPEIEAWFDKPDQ